MPDINEEYENYLRRHITSLSNKIRRRYESAISEVMLSINKVTYNGQVFNVADYPILRQKIDTEIKKMHGSIYGTMLNGINQSWDLSNKKNDLIVDRRIGRKRPDKKVRDILYDPNKGALQQFVARKDKGLNLSQRVWNTLEPFKSELEAGLGLAITNGIPARQMAKEAKKYLNDPDRLYRRVRDSDGKLKLSRPAQAFHPGQGVYRSSFKNAYRLARTENNMAYRTADHERWANMPFVLGIEVKLSAQHPRYDICDNLQGEYPKDFHFRGWHPQCICYQVPKMMSNEDYEKLEDSILGIADFDPNSAQQITKPPAGFNKYVRENKKRIESWQNKPYWVKDNQDYYDQASKSRQPKPELKPAGRTVADQFTQKDRVIRKKVETGLDQIDKVHGDGELKDIPIKKMATGSVQASFAHTWAGNPVEIRVSTKASDKEFSFVHEMGHYFDLHAIGKPGRFESEVHGSPVQKVVARANETEAIKTLQKMLNDGAITFQGATTPLSRNLRKHIEYLVDPKEVWARAYSQFIAKRSESGVLLAGIETRLKSTARTGVPFQWDADDFAVVDEAIEEMMLEIGWMVSR